MNEQETVADIIAEMRALSNPISDGIIAINGRIIADRLEAAHKRELSEVAGLATKYRTALARINALATYCCQPNVREQIIEQCENIFAEERDGKTKETEVKKNEQRLSEWRDICAKCFENGATEPPDCKYYTEDGCMSPIPNQHPLIQVGNAAKLREALGKLRAELWNNTVIAGKRKFELYEIADAALAEPPRNCDVGTVGQQDERFTAFCNRHFNAVGLCDKDCPCRDFNMIGGACSIVWAQMPYEEGGEKVNSCVIIGGNDKAHAAVSIMGRESINKQCYECANCKEPTTGWDGSKFRCAFLGKDFGTWHYDVPNECPCKGKGWEPEEKEGGANKEGITYKITWRH